MKRSIALTTAVLFAFSVQSLAQSGDPWQTNYSYCGVDISTSKMQRDVRRNLQRQGVTPETPANELLLFIDMDGAVLTAGPANPNGRVSPLLNGTTTLPAPALSDAQKAEIIRLVKDDYSPFNIVVTTNQADFDSYPVAANKELCIVSTNPALAGMPAGISGNAPFTNIGTRLPYNPSFVFSATLSNDPISVAAAITHHSAHTFGLYHQPLYNVSCTVASDYHPGFGTSRTAFQPVMGAETASTHNGMFNWFAQTCIEPTFGVAQNDFALLQTQVTVKADDFPNTLGGAAVAPSRVITGRLEQAGDVDFIRTDMKWRGPVTVKSDNIDLKVSVYNGRGQLVQVLDDLTDRDITIPDLNRIRYIKVERAANGNMPPQFMTGTYVINF
jgi:hypothetical protein